MGENGPKQPTQQDIIIAKVNMAYRPFRREQYEWFFRKADKDEDGYLGLKELREFLKGCGYNGSEKDIRKMFQAADVDVDEKISYNEFLIAVGQKPEDSYEHVSLLRRVFALFDKDHSGEIDKKELKHVFIELGRYMPEDQVERVMELADKDGSGTLNYEEFIEAIIKADATVKTPKNKKEKKEEKKDKK